MLLSILTQLAQSCLPVFAQAKIGPTKPGSLIVRDGIGGPEFTQWELSYKVVDYQPVCGLSFEAEGNDY